MRCVVCVEVVALAPGPLSLPHAVTIDTELGDRLSLPLLGTALEPLDDYSAEPESADGEEAWDHVSAEVSMPAQVQPVGGGDNQLDG